MSLKGLHASTIDKMKNRLVEIVQETEGHKIGNVTLKNRLASESERWDNEAYWQLRDILIDEGRIIQGRGRGGSVAIVQDAPPSLEENVAQSGAISTAETCDYSDKPERALYEPVLKVLNADWARDQRFDFQIAEDTSSQGRRDTGGIWTRPDLVVVGLRTFIHLPGKFLDVVTFEIKPRNCFDIKAIYEALAHRRQATMSYVWLHCPGYADESDESLDGLIRPLKDEANKHGIGLIVAETPEDYGTWTTIVEPERIAPDPFRLNKFITEQVSVNAKEVLAKWVR